MRGKNGETGLGTIMMIVGVIVVLMLISFAFTMLSSTVETLPGSDNSMEHGASYFVFNTGIGMTCAKNTTTGKIEFMGSNTSRIFQNVFDKLDSNTSYQRTAYLSGNFTLDWTVRVGNNTRVLLDGSILADPDWNQTSLTGMITIGDANQTIRNVEISGGRLEANFYSPYPVMTWKNRMICGIYSYAVLINCKIHDMSFENMNDPILLEGLGMNEMVASKSISIDQIQFSETYVGIQLYSNGYNYSDVIVSNIFAENCFDDVIAIVGHSIIPAISPSVSNVIVRDVVVVNKNGGAGAVIKLDAGNVGGMADYGVMNNILVENIIAYTSHPDDCFILLYKGTYSSNILMTNLIAKGEFAYGIAFWGSGNNWMISNLDIHANISLFFIFASTPSDGQRVTISHGNLYPRTSICESYTVDGIAICLAAGAPTQGIRNFNVEDIAIMWSEYLIYEGDSFLPTGVQGLYDKVSYSFDIGNRQYAHCEFTSTNRSVEVFDEGRCVSHSYGRVSVTGSVSSVLVNHTLCAEPTLVLVTNMYSELTGVVWIGGPDGTSFTIYFENQPGGVTYWFMWEAKI